MAPSHGMSRMTLSGGTVRTDRTDSFICFTVNVIPMAHEAERYVVRRMKSTKNKFCDVSVDGMCMEILTDFSVSQEK